VQGLIIRSKFPRCIRLGRNRIAIGFLIVPTMDSRNALLNGQNAKSGMGFFTLTRRP
jgi:hypothetical protein